MKTFVLLAVAIGVAQAVSLVMLSQDDDWEAFKAKHGKSYADKVEESFRKMIFMENLQRIAKHNQGNFTYKLGINKFSDMLSTEFGALMNGYKQRPRNQTARVAIAARIEKENDAPDQMDWRDRGAVTPVKDQGSCGSCWSFSATGGLEGQNFLKNGNLVSLSEQNLVDCTKGDPYDNNGCGGGNSDQAFQYISDNGGIDTEDSYPYQGTDNNGCQYQQSNNGAGDSGFTQLSQGDEDALKQAVASIGPISVAIDATDSFKQYQSGVFYDQDNCSSDQTNHAVLVVGYGTDNGNDYWLVKNSWSEGWGEQGYIKMARNNNNMCGIASFASYPNAN